MVAQKDLRYSLIARERVHFFDFGGIQLTAETVRILRLANKGHLDHSDRPQ